MSSLFKDYIGRPVDVWTVRGQSEIKDSGLLVGADEQWIVLEQNGEILYFAIARIRLLKPQR